MSLKKWLSSKWYLFRNKVIPECLFYIKEHDYNWLIEPLYTRYLILKYKNDTQFWFNHLFANDLLQEHQIPEYNLNLSNFMFAMFGHNVIIDTHIYDNYGEEFLNDISLFDESSRIEALLIFLWFFTYYLDGEKLSLILTSLIELIRANPNEWRLQRLRAYFRTHHIRLSKCLDRQEFFKFEAQVFLMIA